MIDRYSRASFKAHFTQQKKFERFLSVELAVLNALAHHGEIPIDSVDAIAQKARIHVDRIETIEATTKHDVVAFIESITEQLGEEKRYFHYGLTSTDIVDTANGLMFKAINPIIESSIKTFIDALKTIAIKHKYTPAIGRTHGIHADITSFGLKMALYVDIFKRHLNRFSAARKTVEAGKISGAVGNHANIKATIQDDALHRLGLNAPNISTQVLQRDRFSEYISVLTLISNSLEQLAVEVRHLSRTEVKEVEEAFKKGQKGSSAMPHKKNPIASENITGCARIMRGYLSMAFENTALWHERDISHSSVERIIFEDAPTLLDYMLTRYTTVIETLVIHEKNMIKNIELTHGVIYAQQVMHALIDKGKSRDEAYRIVQPLAIKAYDERLNFKTIIKEENLLPNNTLEAVFNLENFLKEIDTIYKRIGI